MLTGHQRIAIIRRLPGWTIQDTSIEGKWRLTSEHLTVVIHLCDERQNGFDPREGFSAMQIGTSFSGAFLDEILDALRDVLGVVESYPLELPAVATA